MKHQEKVKTYSEKLQPLLSRYIKTGVCWEFIKSVGEDYQVVKRGREYHGCGDEYNVKKGEGKQYHLPYKIEAVGKNIKCE